MTPLHQDDKNAVIQRYQSRIGAHGVGLDSMKSGDAHKQAIRHAIHATALRGERPTILDVGSGIGQYYQYLLTHGVPCDYTGYDIVGEYVAFCRTTYPQAHFEERNIFEVGIDGMFDTVVMSQVFNNRYAHSDNMAVMAQAMQLAFAHSRVSVSIDMMSSYVDYQSDELFYYAPEAIFALARSMTKRVIIRHDYRPFEFCVQLFHDTVEGYVP